MDEIGVSIGQQYSKDLDEVPVADLDLVVTLCGNAEEKLPAELESIRRIHWNLEDPADASGEDDEIRRVFRETRDDIEVRIKQLLGACG